MEENNKDDVKTKILENPINLKYQQRVAEEEKQRKPGLIKKLKRFWLECKRVLRVTKKPDGPEFKLIVKISALGMAVIGVVGFLIHFIKEIIFK